MLASDSESSSGEEPEDAEIVIDTTEFTAEEAAEQIVLHLEEEGFVAGRLTK